MGLKACCVQHVQLSDNTCGFQHSSSHVVCTVNARTRELNRGRIRKNSNNLMYKHNLGPEKKRLLSQSIIAHLWALKVIANSKVGVSQFTKFRAASCHCTLHLALALLCNCFLLSMIRSS